MNAPRMLALAAAVAACAFPYLAAADDAAALLAKHRAFVGWQYGDPAMNALKLEGEITQGGKTVATASARFLGPAYRFGRLRSSDGKSFDEGFTGSVFWSAGSNSFINRKIGDATKPDISYQNVVLENTVALDGSIMRNQSVGGTATTVVRVIPKPGAPVDLYIDPASGAFKRVVIDPDGRFERTIDILAYADAAPGKKIVSSRRELSSGEVVTWTSIAANRPIAAEDLRPPKPSARWTFGTDDPQPIVNTDDQTAILLAATVNGVKGRFIFDTGAAITVLTDSFARRVGAKRIDRGAIVGVGGSVATNVYMLDTIDFGAGNRLQNVRVQSGLGEGGYNTKNNINGVIGYDLLAAAIVEVDLDALTLRLSDPAKVEPDKSTGIGVVVDLSDSWARIGMKAGDKTEISAILDTGNPDSVIISDELISRDRVPFLRDNNSLTAQLEDHGKLVATGIGGQPIRLECGQLARLSVGPIEYRTVPACRTMAGSTFLSRRDALVGYDFLRHFNYVFDYPDALIVLIPRKT